MTDTALVEMSATDAEAFLVFRRYESTIKTLIDRGALDVKNGSVTLSFNSDGILMDIDISQKIYKRGK